MPRGRPKKYENMTEEEKLEYHQQNVLKGYNDVFKKIEDSRAEEKEAFLNLSKGQRKAIGEAKREIKSFCEQFEMHFEVTDGRTPKAMKDCLWLLENHFPQEELDKYGF